MPTDDPRICRIDRALSVLNFIIAGVCGILLLCCGFYTWFALSMIAPPATGKGATSSLGVSHSETALLYSALVALFFGLLASMAFAAGIGVRRGQPWGRTLTAILAGSGGVLALVLATASLLSSAVRQEADFVTDVDGVVLVLFCYTGAVAVLLILRRRIVRRLVIERAADRG
jgi:hypothetical protein